MNLMVMAGTREGGEIIKKLASLGYFNIVATTTTRYGAELARSAGALEVISRPLDGEEMVDIIETKNIDILVDATHPFAAEATRNAIKSAQSTGIIYTRFERPPIKIPEHDLVQKVHSFDEAVSKVLELPKGRILHLAGVMTLHHLIERIDPQRIVARVLPSVYSVQKCLELGLPAENIIAMQGTFSKDFNRALMKEYEVSLVVTKESGAIGGTPSKIQAALRLGIPVVLVMRPEISALQNEKVFNDVDHLCRELAIYEEFLF
jgi:precorrin-6A/cobalt-precorrin-6A reductase